MSVDAYLNQPALKSVTLHNLLSLVTVKAYQGQVELMEASEYQNVVPPINALLFTPPVDLQKKFNF